METHARQRCYLPVDPQRILHRLTVCARTRVSGLGAVESMCARTNVVHIGRQVHAHIRQLLRLLLAAHLQVPPAAQ